MAKNKSAGKTGASATASGAGLILFTLAAGQFLMALDLSVMNVSIATVAADIGTTVTGVQTAITLYTLVMASLMVLGGKVGSIIGRKRAFSLGCIIYGCGSLTTALAPNLTVLIIGWSFLEGFGAVLIMPAIVALVAGNFPPEGRPRAYGLVAAAGAIAIAVGPVVGGFMTTYFSWRYVFAGEVVLVLIILVLARRAADPPMEKRPHLDLIGAAVWTAGLALFVMGVLKSSVWGWIRPKPGAASLLGLSLTFWFIIAGLFLIWVFMRWQRRLERAGKEPLIPPSLMRIPQLTAGLASFLFQFLIISGILFIMPLFLSVVLGLSPIDTGLRLVPLSVTMLLAAVGIPKLLPRVSPRRAVRFGLLAIIVGILALIGSLAVGADSSIVTVPLLIVGLGMGALASQLGSRDRLGSTCRQEPRSRGTAEHRLPARRLNRDRTCRLGADRGPHCVVPSRDPAEPQRAPGGEGTSQREPSRGRTVHLAGRPRGADGRGRRLPRTHRRSRRSERGLADRGSPRGPRHPRHHGSHRPVLHRADPEAATGFSGAGLADELRPGARVSSRRPCRRCR